MTRETLGVAASKSAAFLATRPDWVIERLAKLPSTNVRIAVSLGVFVATAARYLTARDGWTPSLEWLAFLATSLGLDVLQFGVKRRTQTNGGEPTAPPAITP